MDDLKSVLKLAARFEQKAKELRGAVALVGLMNGGKQTRRYKRRKAPRLAKKA